jgi:hypothetical protein
MAPPWDDPLLLKVTEDPKNRIFAAQPASGNRTAAYLRFLGVLFQNGMAEMIPVEPGQGNACAGKVNQLFYFSFVAFPPFHHPKRATGTLAEGPSSDVHQGWVTFRQKPGLMHN